MSETLTFGPEWLRALSSGNSVTSPPPSPGPKYKLAEHRYGKEEMLALFSEEVKIPEELEMFDSVCRSRPVLPLAFQPLTEEEQRNSLGSVNSNAVLKLMGRGGVRGTGAPRGPGRGGLRGRGRGDGGYVRQTSYEESRGEGAGGFGRGMDSRRQGWNETSGRGAFERSPSLRESGSPGPGRGGYDPSLSRPRLSSDTTWERPERRSDSGNWRSGGATGEDEEGWRISGQRSAERSEKWRGGLTRGRGSWRGGSDTYRERGSHADDDWQVTRGGRRSYHDLDDVRGGSSHERLPEWSNDDSDDFNTPGTFDSSGAFVLHKQKEERESNKWEGKHEEHKQNADKSGRGQSESDASQNEDQDVCKEDEQDDNLFSDTGSSNFSEFKTSDPTVTQSPSSEQEPENIKRSSPPSVSPSSQPYTVQQQTSPTQSTTATESQPEISEPTPMRHPPDGEAMPPVSQKEQKEEEPNMEHFAQAAENLVASLDDDEEDDVKTSSQSKELSNSPLVSDEVQWSYTDPQGKVQGPFTNSEMADWFSHGYFTMGLLVKRTTDDAFQPLGEVIKQWGRVPFIPGPQPPPFKGVPEHVHRQQQQQLIAQQQYQQLMQRHYLQQQLFHQQALMMQQQQQLQHNQQQLQQGPQSPQHSSPQNPSPPSTQLTQTQSTQGRMSPAQAPSRPQALSPHTESIWGAAQPQPTTTPVISPGPLFPTTTSASSKGWDRENSPQSVPSFEEIQRMEEEKEKHARLELERREAQARAIRLKQEEEDRRRLQEAAMMKKQQEEEERRRLEEAERRRKEQEELEKKQLEEARRKQEEEMRRKQETLRKHEQQRQFEMQKHQEDKKRMSDLRQQQQQALFRLQQQQQELLRKKDIQQRELQQKLQQKRQESQATGASLWGAPSSASGTLSLAQIQQQEERERKQRELHLQQLHAQQQREQQARGNPGWADRRVTSNPPPVKSLLQIQQEQAQQLEKRQHGASLSRSQPSHNPLSSSVWGNTGGSLSATWGPSSNSGNIWGTSPSKPPRPPQPSFVDDDDDDDSADDTNVENFWEDAVKAANKQQSTFQQRQQPSTHASRQVHNKSATEKRLNRDEENLRRLFHQQTGTDEFSQWCEQALRGVNNVTTASSVHIPTFCSLIKEVESPYEVYEYVRTYLGDSRETREFAREFIERRKKLKEKTAVPVSGFAQTSVWGVPVPRGPSVGKPTAANQSAGLFAGPPQEDPFDAMNKKKRKKKMQKVDPSILGFSVNAADRVNMGEIQTVED